jgi:hypothetical protein
MSLTSSVGNRRRGLLVALGVLAVACADGPGPAGSGSGSGSEGTETSSASASASTTGSASEGTTEASGDGPKLDVAVDCDELDPGCGQVCPGGEVRDVGPLPFPNTVSGTMSHAWLNPGYFVVAAAGDGTFTWASADEGGTMDPSTLQTSSGYHPHVAFSGDELLVAYAAGNDVFEDVRLRAARLQPDGTLISDALLVDEPGHLQDLNVVWHPVAQQWGLAWSFAPDGYASRVRFARLDAGGTVVAGSLLELNDPQELTQLGDADSLVATDAGYALALEHGDNFELVMFDAQGAIVSESSLVTDAQPHNVALARGVDSFGLAWQASPEAQGFAIYFARADGEGTLLPETQLQWGDASDLSFGNPTVVWDGTRYHVVWLAGDGAGNSQLLHGRPDDLFEGTLVTFAPKYAWFPRALWNGCELVVAYKDGAPGASAAGYLLFIPGPALTPEG